MTKSQELSLFVLKTMYICKKHTQIIMSKLLIVGTVAFDANFEVPKAIVSVVGNDFPEEYIQLLKDKNIDTTSLEVVKDGKTFFWKGKYHNDMNSRDTLETQLNVLENFSPVVPDNFKDAEVVMLGNLHPLVQLSVIKQMQKRPKLVVLDTMNFWMDVALDDLKKPWDLNM